MKREYPTMRGFNRAGLYRMKQFYETYKDNEIVAPLVRQLVGLIMLWYVDIFIDICYQMVKQIKV